MDNIIDTNIRAGIIMENIKMIFATNLKKQRQIMKMSQEQLSFASGLHRTYISDVERGNRNISIENIEKLANALKVDPSQLLKEVENNDKN